MKQPNPGSYIVCCLWVGSSDNRFAYSFAYEFAYSSLKSFVNGIPALQVERASQYKVKGLSATE